MAKGVLVAFTNPVSAEVEEEYNKWYNEVHAIEVTALPGVRSINRYRMHSEIILQDGTPKYRYVAIYDLDDMDVGMKSIVDSAENFLMSTSIDAERANAIGFESVFTYVKP